MSGGVWQAGLALGLAVALHLAVFAVRPGPAGAVASGEAGDALVSVQPADDGLAALVASWDAPPVVAAPAVVAPEAMALPEAPVLPAPEAPPVMAALAPPALPLAADAPLPEAAPLPPPVLAEPPKPTPEARPKPRADKPKAVAKPAAQPPAQAGQKAAGSGGGAQAGKAGKAQAATLSRAQVNDLKAGWGAAIRARVERRKRHPAGAASGTVTVRLVVTAAGALAGVSVAKSSGNPALDAAAVAAVQGAGAFPPAPAGLPGGSHSFTLPMRFQR